MLFLRRVLLLFLSIWLAVTVVFVLLRIVPGDAITAQLIQSGASADEIAAQRSAFGLDQSLLLQYIQYITGLLRGDLGYSLSTREPVASMIARSLWPTLSLAIGALVVASILGIGLGISSGLQRPALVVRMSQSILGLALAVPIYWSGTIALYIFTVQLSLLPSAGAGRLSQLILPVLVLGFHTAGAIGRVTQANVMETLEADYIRTAKAKGLANSQILTNHVLKASLLPTVSIIALQAGFLLSGAVITESIFVRPGIGRLLLQATLEQDYPVVQGIMIVTAIGYSLIVIVADWISARIDPRLDS